jgi:hypothetical protein
LTRSLERLVVLLGSGPQLDAAFPCLLLHIVYAQIEQFRSLRESEPALRKSLERVLLRCSVEPLLQGGGLVGVLLVAAQFRQLQDTLGNAEWIRTIGHTLHFFSKSAKAARAA